MSGDENAQGGAAGAGEDTAETLGSLQARLAEHGRKLAESAGERVQGLSDAADEKIAGVTGAAAGISAAVGGIGETLGGYADGARRTVGDAIDAAGEKLGFGGGEEAAQEADGELNLHESTRLPWLESADDDNDEYGSVDTRRVAMFVVMGLALLAAIVGGIWWSTHRGTGGEQVADGSTIKAPTEPYKTAPANPGGKTYEGTGDSSYAVSQGQNPAAHLGSAAAGAVGGAAAGAVNSAEQAAQVATAAAKAAGGAAAEAAKAAGAAAHDAAAHGSAALGAVTGPAGGTGVQVGAYTSQAGAEAGWAKLEKQYAPLANMRHRIVQGQADIGTVYRLQAVTESDAAAGALCSAMKAQGLACQVRH